MRNTCYIELGSNGCSDAFIRGARQMLKDRFPDIVFGTIQTTEPVDFVSPHPFRNQTGRFSTPLPQEELSLILKHIEKTLGRRPEDKAKGVVKIDIDLVVYNGMVLKEKDLQREYVRAGLYELGYSPE